MRSSGTRGGLARGRGVCACGVLARCRDGRPIKLEGNPDHALARGGLCPTGQADVLSLYDGERLRGPHEGGTARSWEDAHAALSVRLDELRRNGGRVRVLTGTIVSPSTSYSNSRNSNTRYYSHKQKK